MSKWKKVEALSGDFDIIAGSGFVCYELGENDASAIVNTHNADIDALTAERDEARAQLAQWRSDFSKAMERAKQAETQRDAIIAMLEPEGSEPYENGQPIASYEECLDWDMRSNLHARAVAIREGREE